MLLGIRLNKHKRLQIDEVQFNIFMTYVFAIKPDVNTYREQFRPITVSRFKVDHYICIIQLFIHLP